MQNALALVRDATRDHALDAIDAEVERTVSLARFEARPGAGEPYHHVEFQPGTPQWPEGPMFETFAQARLLLDAPAPLVALMDALEELQRSLVFRADCAEFTDARFNSIQYLHAAGRLGKVEPHVVELARRLGGGG